MMKREICTLLLVVTPLSTLAASHIPQKFQGTWDKAKQCYTPAVINKKQYTPDADWGLATVNKIVTHNANSITVYGTEEYFDEGNVYKTPSHLKLTLAQNGKSLKIVGKHHESNYNVQYVRCS